MTEEIFKIINPSGSIGHGVIDAYSSFSHIVRERIEQEKGYPILIGKLNYLYYEMENTLYELPDLVKQAVLDNDETKKPHFAEVKNATIQFYVSEELKRVIETRADSLWMDNAQFLRISALADSQVYLIEKGHYISRYIIEMFDLLNMALLEDIR